MLKIVSGKFRGRVLKTPKGNQTRPTASRVRQAVFNIYPPEGMSILDICAGTGAIGFEALSLGAESVVFIEMHQEVVSVLKSNIALLGVSSQCAILPFEALKGIKKLEGKQFDFIYIDPPYDYAGYGAILESIEDISLLAQGGKIFLETRGPLTPVHLHRLVYHEERKMGDTFLHIFVHGNTNPLSAYN